MCENRRGLTAHMTACKPYSREEQDFIKAFANMLSHATAVVAANPEIAVPAGSIAHQVREAYSRFRPNLRPAIQERAKARLAGSPELRRRYFGAYADLGPQAWAHATPGLSSEMKQQLRRAVRARLDAQRDEIAGILSAGAATNPNLYHGSFPSSKTTLDVGYFSGDAQAAWKTLTISSPINIELLWKTNVAGAERGVWQLFHSGNGQEVLLGSGIAGNAPSSIFTINLGNYLPAQPPDVQAVYRIRVTPGTKAKVKSGSAQGQGPQWVPGQAVGPPSNDVVITYSAVTTPIVDFQIFDIYHTATFMLESIHMVEDQNGPGTEEFHVAGFVQESFPASSTEAGSQQKFGPFYAELDPDGPRTKNLPHSAAFYLNQPGSLEWPRAYTVVISVLEEDDGGSLNDWESSVWDVAQQAASGEIGQEIRDFIEEKFEDYVGDNIGQLINAGGQLAQEIVSLASSITGGIIGMVVMAAALVISDIISGMSDDYYGTEAFVLVLPTNITDFVHSLPGQHIADGFQLDTESLEFRGYTSWPEAAIFDGVVDVFFHWELTNKGQSV
jgi:hypothetical protein